MKVAILGCWHVHADEYTVAAKKFGEVVGVYEADAQRKNAFAEKYGIKAFSTLDELLESDAEGVIVCSSSDRHALDMIAAANAGKHVFTEKVLALTVDECIAVKEAVEKNGVQFVISLFQKYDGAIRAAKAVMDSGELGKVNYVRFRNCHTGSIDNWLPTHFYNAKECGGGAMIDLGAHGMYIIDWLLGTPASYSSTFTVACDREDVKAKNTDGVEDNAVTVMGYANGAIAINETGFVSRNYPRILEIGGEKGVVKCEGGAVTKSTSATEGKAVTVMPLEALPKPIEQFLTGKVLDGCGIDEGIRLTEMMMGAYGN